MIETLHDESCNIAKVLATPTRLQQVLEDSECFQHCGSGRCASVVSTSGAIFAAERHSAWLLDSAPHSILYALAQYMLSIDVDSI